MEEKDETLCSNSIRGDEGVDGANLQAFLIWRGRGIRHGLGVHALLYPGNGFLVQDPVNIDRETSFFPRFPEELPPRLTRKRRNPGFSLRESKIRLTVEFYLGTLIHYMCGLFSLNSGVLPVFGR